jgi:hypothetical protein
VHKWQSDVTREGKGEVDNVRRGWLGQGEKNH